MKSVFAAGLVAVASARTEMFGEWARKHGKQYASKEELVMRRAIFAANLAKIEAHNAGQNGWKMAMNSFGDMTSVEFKARMASGLRAKAPRAGKAKKMLGALNISALPASVDWTTKGAVTPVKNQGQCGSCWAFSTTGALEGATFLATGKLLSLSEQELVDCSSSAGNQGCNGGLMDNAFTWINSNGGLGSEAAYPYTGTDGTCHAATSVASVGSHTDVTPNSDTAMMTAIAQQPVSIAVEADQSSFQFYSSGVMTAACGTNLDHGVLAVGYGTDSGADYYKVKNSWGADWGMSGYILLGRGSSYNGGAGQCGILSQPSWPTYAAPGAQPSIAPAPSSGPSNDSTTGGGGGSTTTTGGGGGGSTTTGSKVASKVRASTRQH